MTIEENANNSIDFGVGVNIKLGKHMKGILLHLYEKKEYEKRQVSIIREVCDLYDYERAKMLKIYPKSFDLPVSRSLRVSMSRAFSALEKHGLIYRQYYKYQYEYKGRPLYHTWEKNGDYVQVRSEIKPPKTWISKPWFGITEQGIEYVNNLDHLTPDVNVLHAQEGSEFE